jgi:hypothetical protein
MEISAQTYIRSSITFFSNNPILWPSHTMKLQVHTHGLVNVTDDCDLMCTLPSVPPNSALMINALGAHNTIAVYTSLQKAFRVWEQ